MTFATLSFAKTPLGICVIFALLLGCDHSSNLIHHKDFYNFSDRNQGSDLAFSRDFFPNHDLKILDDTIPNQVARHRLRQAEAVYSRAMTEYYPLVTADLSRNEQKFSPFGFRPNRADKLTTYQAGLHFTLIPDFFGKLAVKQEIAKKQTLLKHIETNLTQLNTVNSYVKNYMFVCHLEQVQKINQQTIDLNHQLVQSTETRYKLGRTQALDYLNARDNLKSAQAMYYKTKQNLDLATESYYNLLGKKTPKTPQLCQTHPLEFTIKPVKIPIRYLDNRPDLQLARTQVEIVSDQVDLSLKEIYPDTTLLFNLNDVADTIPDILDAKQLAWSFITQITHVLYDRGVRNINTIITKEEFKIAQLNYKNQMIRAVNTATTTQKLLTSLMQQQEIVQQRLETAQQAIDLAKLQYANGTITFLQLLTTERNFYQATTEVAITNYQIRTTYTDFLSALGIFAVAQEKKAQKS